MTFVVGDGTADPNVTFEGTLAAVNAALNGMQFLPTLDFNGPSYIVLATTGGGRGKTIPFGPYLALGAALAAFAAPQIAHTYLHLLGRA